MHSLFAPPASASTSASSSDPELDAIRTHHSHIHLAGGKGFQTATLKDLSAILQTSSGRALLDAFEHQKRHHDVTIGPSATPFDAHMHVKQADKLAHRTTDHRGVDDGIVKYAAGKLVDSPRAKAPYLPMRSDVALYHELVHALHAGDGTLDKKHAEDQAIGLNDHAADPLTENHYRDERRHLGTLLGDVGMPGRDSHEFTPLPDTRM
jgi:hypothetical protein